MHKTWDEKFEQAFNGPKLLANLLSPTDGFTESILTSFSP